MTQTTAAEALFASSLQPSDHPTALRVTAAIHDSLGRPGGADACTAAVATAYGDHPESSAARMRWAIALAEFAGRSTLVAA